MQPPAYENKSLAFCRSLPRFAIKWDLAPQHVRQLDGFDVTFSWCWCSIMWLTHPSVKEIRCHGSISCHIKKFFVAREFGKELLPKHALTSFHCKHNCFPFIFCYIWLWLKLFCRFFPKTCDHGSFAGLIECSPHYGLLPRTHNHGSFASF